MNYILQKIRYFSLGIVLLTSTQLFAQNSYLITNNQEFKVEGTSTLHDWEMISSSAKGQGSIAIQNNKIIDINSLSISLPVNSLKSGKDALDKNAFKALNADEYPQIQLELTKVVSTTNNVVKAYCQLSISGTTNPVTIEANYQVSTDTVLFSGSFPLTFTQFKIDPPKAMFGTIKTGNELQISFETIFKTTN
jgi:hypothetical protein